MQQQQQQQQFVQQDGRKQAFNRDNPDGVDFLRRFQNRYQKTDGLFQSDNANLRTPQGWCHKNVNASKILHFLIKLIFDLYRVCPRFRLTKRDDYFWVNFDHCWSEYHFLRQLGQ